MAEKHLLTQTTNEDVSAFLRARDFCLSGGVVFRVNLNGNTSTWSGVGGSGATELTASTTDLWIKDANGTWRYDTSTSASGTWIKMVGPYTSFAGSGAFLFALSGTQPYHFNAIAPRVKVQTSGSYDCNGFPNNQCPSGSGHYIYAKNKWSDGGTTGSTVTASSTACPSCYQSATVQDVDPWCDLIYGVDGSLYCYYQSSGSAICNVMGTLMWTNYAVQEQPYEFGPTYTKFVTTSTTSTSRYSAQCGGYSACTNGTPVCNITHVDDESPIFLFQGWGNCAPGYHVFGLEERFYLGNGTWSQWSCVENYFNLGHALTITARTANNQPSNNCTVF
jgi:hypothetical protein